MHFVLMNNVLYAKAKWEIISMGHPSDLQSQGTGPYHRDSPIIASHAHSTSSAKYEYGGKSDPIPDAEVRRHGYRVDEGKLETIFMTNLIEILAFSIGTGVFLHIVRDDVDICHRLNHFCQRRRFGDQRINCGQIGLCSVGGWGARGEFR